MNKEPQWLNWTKRIQAIAQSGLTYSDNPYEIERYEELRNIAAEMLAGQWELERTEVADFFAREKGYATPKVDTRGAVIKDGKILLVKEKADGRWTLPGGWADVGLTPSENVVREVKEESGFDVKVKRLAAVYDRTAQGHLPYYPFHIYKLFFLCDITGGEAASSYETTDVGFFAPDNLPELSAGRVLPHQIELMFRHEADASLPVYFD